MDDLEHFDATSQALDDATPLEPPLYWTAYNSAFREVANTTLSEGLGCPVQTDSILDQMLTATYAKGWDMGVSIVAQLLDVAPDVLIEALSVFNEEDVRPPLSPSLIAHLRSFGGARQIDWRSDLDPFVRAAKGMTSPDMPAAND